MLGVEPRFPNLRLLVRHGVVVESSSFFSLICRCAEKALSLWAQVFENFWIFEMLLLLVHDSRGRIFGFGGVSGAWLANALLPGFSGTDQTTLSTCQSSQLFGQGWGR